MGEFQLPLWGRFSLKVVRMCVCCHRGLYTSVTLLPRRIGKGWGMYFNSKTQSQLNYPKVQWAFVTILARCVASVHLTEGDLRHALSERSSASPHRAGGVVWFTPLSVSQTHACMRKQCSRLSLGFSLWWSWAGGHSYHLPGGFASKKRLGFLLSASSNTILVKGERVWGLSYVKHWKISKLLIWQQVKYLIKTYGQLWVKSRVFPFNLAPK